MRLVMFISPAYAQSGAGSPDFGFLFLMVGIFIIFYFFLIRPNQKKEKERRNMQSSLKRGDKILTAGGLFGSVVKAKEGEERINIEISEGVKIETERRFITEMIQPNEKKLAMLFNLLKMFCLYFSTY